MPSSTSSSEQIGARRAVATLLGVLTLIGVALELTGSLAFVRVSRIQRRIDTEYKEAVRIGAIAADGKPTMLVAGNSLMLEGLDLPRLQAEIGSRYQASTFFVEQTLYMDWYYALKKLFHGGSRPQIVVLGLATNHLVIPGVRGEYFAHFMMRPSDTLDVASQLHLDATTASNFFLASLSGWLGAKSEIRKWVLIRAMPDLDAVGNLLRPGPPTLPESDTLKKRITLNLLALKEVCDAHSSRSDHCRSTHSGCERPIPDRSSRRSGGGHSGTGAANSRGTRSERLPGRLSPECSRSRGVYGCFGC